MKKNSEGEEKIIYEKGEGEPSRERGRRETGELWKRALKRQ
jgi:hypothetical protein